jgi:hypothetical protein
MEQYRDWDLAEALQALDTPAYSAEFDVSLWSAIGEAAAARAEHRRSRSANRFRRATMVLAALCVALIAVAVAVSSSSALAKTLPFGVGKQLRALETMNASLQAQLHRAQQTEEQRSQAIAQAYQAMNRASINHAAQSEAQRTNIASLITSYFGARAETLLPGQAGQQALAVVKHLSLPTSTLSDQLRYVSVGAAREAAARGDTLLAAGTIVGISNLTLGRARALVTVYPVVDYAVWADRTGTVMHNNYTGVYHLIELTRSHGQWRVASDQALDQELPRLLKLGGAPTSMVMAAAQNIRRLQTPRPAPPEAVTIIKRLINLLNRQEYAQTAALFASGRSWRPLPGVRYRLQFQSAVAVYSALTPPPLRGVLLQVETRDSSTGNTPGFPTFFAMTLAKDGRWAIVSLASSP